jgi:hypothetical protein
LTAKRSGLDTSWSRGEGRLGRSASRRQPRPRPATPAKTLRVPTGLVGYSLA